MEIHEFVKKYKLSQKEGVDIWKHKQSGKHILTHDACTKIANIENIYTDNIECLHSSDGSIRLLITMIKKEDGDSCKKEVTIGEASKENVKMSGGYLGCMAEKRGKDRAILKLINAYEHGIASEIEADDYQYQGVEKTIIKNEESVKGDESNIDDIIEASNGVKVVDDIEITFGRNKGKMVSECDKKYQKWLSTSELDFKTFKNPDGSLKVDEIKKLNDCAKYYLEVNN